MTLPAEDRLTDKRKPFFRSFQRGRVARPVAEQKQSGLKGREMRRNTEGEIGLVKALGKCPHRLTLECKFRCDLHPIPFFIE